MTYKSANEGTAIRHRKACPKLGQHYSVQIGDLAVMAGGFDFDQLPRSAIVVDGPQTRGPHPPANTWRCLACGWFKWRAV